ncbi:hypothetical protein [Sphingomonas trueperi]|uniref:hypothetical protein n=1 Tax=Sphingomonas trueperi TaxID=53317 RepID=UPI000EB223F1
MADHLQARLSFVATARAALASPPRAAAAAEELPLPKKLQDWLSRLQLLKGVPFAYLVPDERMLPPESIRFFTLDFGWTETLADGALSIGRTLGRQAQVSRQAIEAAATAHATPLGLAGTPNLRARALGVPAVDPPESVITGFLLRSKLVSNTPGMGVNVYPKGNTPADHDRDPSVKIVLLDILRYETLGDQSDVLICLVKGDAFRVDIHQPPEQLHYGLDAFSQSSSSVNACKNIHTFTVQDGEVTLSPEFVTKNVSDDFRGNHLRVANMTALAGCIAKVNGRAQIDAAEMGFEMTQGVGSVSFIKDYGS